jgi:UDP-N-acetylglucosamine--N-acetylmuramyl-(pentapeptide) pyrophosphoryl-undecaprenol N-acetylglucosamine transferase
MNIAITGGGTGGHLSIAKAMKNAFLKEGHTVIFIGSLKGQDRDWFLNDKDFKAVYFLDTRGVVNQKKINKILSLWQISKATIRVFSIFKLHKIDKVFSVGGFSAAPASFASILTRRPLFIHEQNAKIGNLNKILKPFSKKFFSSYLKESSISDYPISKDFFDTKRLRKEIKTIIFLGGSQGARFINEFALSVAPLLRDKNINIIHQCGKIEYDKVNKAYKSLGINAKIFAFSNTLLEDIKKADLAVSRAGASTLWEISANGLPALFIPFPYASDDHQYFNAKFLYDEKLCFLEIENQLNENIIIKILDKDISKISEKLISSINKNGVQKIIDSILELN